LEWLAIVVAITYVGRRHRLWLDVAKEGLQAMILGVD
jgi:hypothetical protein